MRRSKASAVLKKPAAQFLRLAKVSLRAKEKHLVTTAHTVIRRPTCVRYIPLFAQLEASSECNLRCVMCPRTCDVEAGPEKSGDGNMSVQLFENVINALPSLSRVSLHGFGEPMLNPGFIDMVKIFRARRLGIVFSTNGTPLNDSLASEMVDLDVEKVGISVDAARPSTYETIRPGSKYDRVIENTLGLIELKRTRGQRYPICEWSFGVMSCNVAELPEFVRVASEIGVDSLYVQRVVPSG